MLSVLRHKGVAKKVLWFTTIIIVLSFGFFGVANRLDHSINTAGKMYGHNVSINDFQKAYLDSRDQAIMLYGDQYFKYGSRLNLESEAWDRLILLHEAKKRGIKVSDQEIVDEIATKPFFQRDGKFDQSLYEMIVQAPSLFDRKVHEFEESVRSQLIIKKLIDQAAGVPAEISDAELKKQYTLKNEKLEITYALFEPLVAAKDVKVSDEEVKQYYTNNKEQFRKAPMINVEYVEFKFPAKATDLQKAEIKKQAQALSKLLKKDIDFRAMALAQKAEVKESGLFSQNQPILTFAWSPELVQKIFAMKLGEYSPAIEDPDGWMILHIKEHQESVIPEFDQIKDDVKKALLTEKGFSIAKTRADAAYKTIQDGIKANKTFKELAAATGAKVEETPSFGRGEYIANMGIIAEFQEVTQKLNMQNRLSEVITTSQGSAIIYLDNIEPIDEKQFESDKTNFKEMMLAQAKNQAIVGFLTKLKLEANVQSKIDKGKK